MHSIFGPLRTGQHAPLPHRRLSRGSPYRWGKSAPTRQGRAAHLSRALGQPFLSPRGPTCSSSQLLRAAAAAAAGRCTHLKDRSETERFDYWVCGVVCAADPWCCEENENACKNRRLHGFHMSKKRKTDTPKKIFTRNLIFVFVNYELIY